MFNLHNEPSSGLSLAGLAVQPFSVDRGTAKFDLSVALVEGSSGLQAGFEYNTDLFERDTVDLLLRHYGELLWAVAHDAGTTLSGFAMTSTAASPQPPSARLADWPADSTLVQQFAQAAEDYAGNTAVSTPAHTWTYAELNERANAVALALMQGRDSCAGERVGLLLGHDAPMLAGLLGTLKAGAAYVPLDPGAPPARLQQVISEAGISRVVTAAECAEQVKLQDVAVIVCSDERVTHNPEVQPGAAELAYILFTSGSTGTPKGVMQTHRNVVHHAQVYSQALQLGPTDRLSLLSNFGFDAAVMDIFGALLTGACLLPMALKEENYTGELLDRMGEERITVLHATPTVFRHLMRNKVCRHDLTCVRYVVLGGEEATPADFAQFRKQFAPPTLFVNGMGPSESTLALQFLPITARVYRAVWCRWAGLLPAPRWCC